METIEELKSEIDRLKKKCDMQSMMLMTLFPEDSGTLFITGFGGVKDKNDMPEWLYVAPKYGVDFFYTYERIKIINEL